MRRKPKAESKLLKTICRTEHSLTPLSRTYSVQNWREHLSWEWHQCVYLGRRGGGRGEEEGTTERTIWGFFLQCQNQVMESQMFEKQKEKKLSLHAQSISRAAPPLCVHLGGHWQHSRDPPSLCFAYSKQSKAGRWEGLGKRMGSPLSPPRWSEDCCLKKCWWLHLIL